jgi:energy-coupling factor transporter ATP-binding protein EcfA2
MKKWILTGCLFALMVGAHAQKGDSQEENLLPTGYYLDFEQNGFAELKSIRPLTDRAAQARVMLSGENHMYSGFNSLGEYRFLKFFHEQAGVRHFVIELSPTRALYMERYFTNTDSTAKRFLRATSSDDYMKLIERVSEISEKFYSIEEINYDGEVEKAVKGLGFEREDFTRSTSEFSGGWRMRIELAKILLQKPDLILLDEPTNHLDIESIQWLEDFLVNNAKAVVVISHDRAFVDNITNRTIEVTMGRIYDYKAKYTKGMTTYEVPARIPAKVARKIQTIAYRVYRGLGLKGFSRVDVMLDRKNRPYVLEVNSIPGLTEFSLLPKAARSAGISFEELCLRVLRDAYERKGKK